MSMFDGIHLLDTLTEVEKSNLEAFCQEKEVKEGELLFSQGEEANAMYILIKGGFRIYQDIDGKDITIGRVFSEEILGEMALFGNDQKRMATAIAIEDSRLITIASFSIKELSQKSPEVLAKIKAIISSRMISNKILKNNIGKD